MRNSKDNKHIVVGLFIIVIGVLALLDNLDIFNTGRILRFWPTIFIALGGLKLIQSRSANSCLVGAIMIGAGVVWTLKSAGFLLFNMHQWWPVFLILAGLVALTKKSHEGHCIGSDGERQTGTENIPGDVNYIDTAAVMSGHKLKSGARAFRGGEITAVMGGVELDLRQANIETEATLRVFAFWGGVEIRIPDDWAVTSDAVAIMGGIEDKSHPPVNATKRLIIKGYAIMGGVEIKN